jgi:uncharacterized lipoprotein YddW (UPF0748 family)
MKRKWLLLLSVLLLAPLCDRAADSSSSASTPAATVAIVLPPPPAREFRAVWIATVGNSCWPSKPGLTTAQQKAELLAIFDRAVALKLNAVIFQVRPACDALYQSSLEPWSEYLTGVQGRAPSPYYDPLAFAITEAHKRGLELHAWFNPFRAHFAPAVSPIAPNHISQTHPELIRSYSKLLWLDPGDPAARDYSLRVVMDVLKRYDVDGIHFDDYFYPYHEKNSKGADIDFPDEATWRKYGQTTGLSRDDWRRHNVDAFIQTVYLNLKSEKPWVKFGISPFGIWRPKNPPSINGLDAYAQLYCDSRKWLHEGWCDYLSPQLYWGIQPPQTSFSTLLSWWNGENIRHRHIWPGMDSLRAGDKFPASEIVNQIAVTRAYPDSGHIHWSASALMKNSALATVLVRDVYSLPALIPASPWLNATTPPPPRITVKLWKQTAHIEWKNAGVEPARLWVLQTREKGVWTTQILPAARTDAYLDNANPDVVALRAASRVETLSLPAIWTSGK